MKVMIIVGVLPISPSERMRDLYLTAIKAHVALGYETFVLQSIASWTPDFAKACNELGATLIPDATQAAKQSSWLEFIHDPIFFGPRRLFANAMAAATEFFAQHGPPDVITGIMSTKYTGVPAYLLSRTLGVPYVIWEHLTHYQRPELSLPTKLRVRQALRECDRLVAVSEPLLNNIRTCLGLELTQGGVLPNPIPNSFFDKPSHRLQEVEDFRQGRFLCAGWTNWRDIKRADIFLQTMAHLADKNICAVIAGPTLKNIPRLLKKLGLQNSVLLLGPLERDQIHALAHQTDCCVLSSDHETFGLPALEAMAAGKPVVTTLCGGPETLVREPFLGKVVPTKEPQMLAQAILHVQQNPDLYPADRIRQFAWRNYSKDPFTAHWSQLYQGMFNAQQSKVESINRLP